MLNNFLYIQQRTNQHHPRIMPLRAAPPPPVRGLDSFSSISGYRPRGLGRLRPCPGIQDRPTAHLPASKSIISAASCDAVAASSDVKRPNGNTAQNCGHRGTDNVRAPTANANVPRTQTYRRRHIVVINIL